MGTTRLQIYNGALLLCKERAISSLTENCEARRQLDGVWNDNGVRYCLEQGQWQFAMRATRIDYDPDVTTEFGYRYAFGKPDDWVETCAVCSDERFMTPVTQYADETDYWTADITPLYIKYVSDDDQFGNNLARWPQSFTEYVQAHFAGKIVLGITGSKDLAAQLLETRGGIIEQRRIVAKNRAAMTQPTKYPAIGSWTRARVGSSRRGPMGDGGTSGSLTG